MATPNQEDYLEVIFRLTSEKGYARVVDIAEALHISQASVSKMIRKLNQSGLLEVVKYRGLAMTERGAREGGVLLRRHQILEQFLRNLGISDPERLYREVEGIEHYCSPQTLKRLHALNQHIHSHPRWWKNFLKEAARQDPDGK